MRGIADPRVPYFQLLTSRTFIGCCAATFGAYWALSLGLTWFTPFIVQGLGFSQKDAGWVSVLPWVFGAVVVLIAGWVSQVMLTRGYTTRGARGVLGSVPLIIGGLILATMPYSAPGGMMIEGSFLPMACSPSASGYPPAATTSSAWARTLANAERTSGRRPGTVTSAPCRMTP